MESHTLTCKSYAARDQMTRPSSLRTEAAFQHCTGKYCACGSCYRSQIDPVVANTLRLDRIDATRQ